eukprot:7219130-Pyramimonas_sp.AAC.1
MHPGASSDFIPVTATVSLPTPKGRFSVPKWIGQHADYHIIVSEQLWELTLPSDPAQKLARVKEVVGTTAVEFKKALECRPAGNDSERLHF